MLEGEEILHKLLYKWNYWQVKYLAICSNNTVGGILNWWISVATVWKEPHAWSMYGSIIVDS